jgi:hypothetical protein
MSPAGFLPTIAAGERLWTHILNRPATGTGTVSKMMIMIIIIITHFKTKAS